MPIAGAVTVLTLTEKQYEGREVLVDSRPNAAQTSDPGPQLTLVF